MQCYAALGAASSSEWQELYLARGMVEALIPCAAEAQESSPEALKVRTLFDLEQRSSETVAAVAAERRALRSGTPDDMQSAAVARRLANASGAWQEVLQAFQSWQGHAPQDERLFACFQRRQAICEAALGAE